MHFGTLLHAVYCHYLLSVENKPRLISKKDLEPMILIMLDSYFRINNGLPPFTLVLSRCFSKHYYCIWIMQSVFNEISTPPLSHRHYLQLPNVTYTHACTQMESSPLGFLFCFQFKNF